MGLFTGMSLIGVLETALWLAKFFARLPTVLALAREPRKQDDGDIQKQMAGQVVKPKR